jgi:Restriction endonuclease
LGRSRLSGVFIRPASRDDIRVIEAWEHPVFADWAFMKVPEDRRIEAVGSSFLESPGWIVFEERRLAGELIILDFPQYYRTEEGAQSVAERHVTQARAEYDLKDGRVDEAALRQICIDLAELETSKNPQRRGKQFEGVIERLFRAHACQLELGKQGRSEQVDLLMIEPQAALIECRWKNQPLQPEVISNILGKLLKRPAGVVGIYVSMSGFTRGAIAHARDVSRERGIVLLGPSDVMTLARGEIKFRAFWRQYTLELLRRYDGD